jgi:hypothetical protein
MCCWLTEGAKSNISIRLLDIKALCILTLILTNYIVSLTKVISFPKYEHVFML